MVDEPRHYPKRLIEVDLPIKKLSAHALRERSIRHGHISTLHVWWARRQLAACRAPVQIAHESLGGAPWTRPLVVDPFAGGTGRGEALLRFLVDDDIGIDQRFWKLAQSLSALYPRKTDEKRWVDGVLARKKARLRQSPEILSARIRTRAEGPYPYLYP